MKLLQKWGYDNFSLIEMIELPDFGNNHIYNIVWVTW